MVITNSPDFLSKIFAKHYLTALKIVSCTVNRNNKHNNTSNALLGTSALKVKFWHFYSNYGCNTKKMVFSKVHTKNMDLSYFTIGAAAIWCQISFYILWRPDGLLTFFHKTKKKKRIFLKIVSLAKFLWRSKTYSFLFFNLFQITCDGFFIFACLKLQEFCWRQKPYGIHVQEMLKWVINTRTTHLIRSTCIIYYHSH